MRGTGLFSWGLLFAAALLCSCGGGSSAVKFTQTGHTAVDESALIIRSQPQHIAATGPDQIAFVSSGTLGVYNCSSGKMVRSFSSADSLNTALRKISWPFDSARGIVYLPPDTATTLTGDDLFKPFFGVEAFDYSNGTFYIVYKISIDWHYRTLELAAASLFGSAGDAAEQTKKLLQTPGLTAENFQSFGNAQFLIETDTAFQIRRIRYINEQDTVRKTKGYAFCSLALGFTVHQNTIYGTAYDYPLLFTLPETQQITAADSLLLAAQLGMNESIGWKQVALRTSDIPGYLSDIREHTRHRLAFGKSGNELLLQTAAGWYLLPEKKLFSPQPEYSKKEKLFADFDVQENFLLYSVYREEVKADTAIQFRIYDAEAGKLVFTKAMNCGAYFGKHANTYYFINRSGEQYFIDTYQLSIQ
ncbi:MAG: hypothetical protein IM638_08335 [Bacteroidetes bacterium]|nr:hypothetical protein [Bacteroidota bacterium]